VLEPYPCIEREASSLEQLTGLKSPVDEADMFLLPRLCQGEYELVSFSGELVGSVSFLGKGAVVVEFKGARIGIR
jgi:hypothetical protein